MAGSLKDFENMLAEMERGIFTRKNKSQLAVEARDVIKLRTQAGGGVSSDNVKSPGPDKIDKVSPGYAAWRKKNPGGGQHSITSGRKSNLTYTGQLLKAIKISLTARGFELNIAGTSRTGSSLTNKQVAEKVSRNGRPFFALTKDEQQLITQMVDDIVREHILRIVKKFL